MSGLQEIDMLSDTFPLLCNDPIVPFSTKPGIPPNHVALLAYDQSEHHNSYYLAYNRHEVIIQTPNTIEGSDDPCDFAYSHWLEILQSVLNTVEWGKSNRAVLIKSKKKGYFVQSMRPAVRFSLESDYMIKLPPCPPWAPMINEHEILYTAYGERQPCERRGLWKGHRLDIHYAWDNNSFYLLNRTMWAHRMLEGRTPKVLADVVGHIKNAAGYIIGIATEANEGRALTCKEEDRTKVYAAVSAIQNWGFIYHPCLENKFMIVNDGSVRFTEVHCLEYIPDRARRERRAETTHWAALDELFFELSITQWGSYGWFRIPPSRLTSDIRRQRYIAPPVSPERPLGSIIFLPPFFELFGFPMWPGYQQSPRKLWRSDTDKETTYRRRRESQRKTVYQRKYLLGAINAEDEILEELSLIPAHLIQASAGRSSQPRRGSRCFNFPPPTADLPGYQPSDQAEFVGDFDSDGQVLPSSASSSPSSSTLSPLSSSSSTILSGGEGSSDHRGATHAEHSGSSWLRQRLEHTRSPPSFHPYAMHSNAPPRTGSSSLNADKTRRRRSGNKEKAVAGEDTIYLG